MSSLVGGHELEGDLICSADSLLESAALNIDWWRPQVSKPQSLKATLLTFRETTVITKHLAEGIAADYDSEGRLAGIEILPKLCTERWCGFRSRCIKFF